MKLKITYPIPVEQNAWFMSANKPQESKILWYELKQIEKERNDGEIHELYAKFESGEYVSASEIFKTKEDLKEAL